jgi:hypothetical protein
MPRQNKTIPHQPLRTNNSCSSKRRYISEQQALDTADYQMLLNPTVQLAVYHCDQCGGWHLTNVGKK